MSEKEPAWLLSKTDQRLALMKDSLGGASLSGYELVMSPLTEPPEDASKELRDAWEHTCDNCGKYCPTTLWTGSVTRDLDGKQVIFTFGACPECAEK